MKFIAGNYYVALSGCIIAKAIRPIAGGEFNIPLRTLWDLEVVFDVTHGTQVPRPVRLFDGDVSIFELDPVRLGALYEKVARLSVTMQQHWSDPDYSRICLEQEEHKRREAEEATAKLKLKLDLNAYNNPCMKWHVT